MRSAVAAYYYFVHIQPAWMRVLMIYRCDSPEQCEKMMPTTSRSAKLRFSIVLSGNSREEANLCKESEERTTNVRLWETNLTCRLSMS